MTAGIPIRYNPFGKSLFDFSPDELGVLRDVTEGWFVDYKSEALSAKDFGKHLSAFANQYGGWLFIGVSEGPEKSLKAGSFPGIPTEEVGKALVLIRDGASAHVSPTVFFEYRVIDGPIESIQLSAGRSVIVVRVPEGANPPFVHSTGKIYRRIADSSDPKGITDRAVLDQMWRKSEELRIRMRDFILGPTRQPRSDNTFCYVFLMEDLTFFLPDRQLDLAGFKKALSPACDELFSITLDNTFPTQDGFIGRHYMGANNPLWELLSLRWWRNGNVRLAIPVNLVTVPHSPAMAGDPTLRTFLELMGNHRSHYQRLLNLDEWILALVSLIHQYLKLRDVLKSTEPIFGKVLFVNAGFSVPFLAMDSFIRVVADYGVPVVQDAINLYPLGDSGGFQELADDKAKDQVARAFNLTMVLVFNALKALGVTFDIDATDLSSFAADLGKALDKVSARNKARSTKHKEL